MVHLNKGSKGSKFRRFYTKAGKIVRPVAGVIKRVAPIGGAIIGSLLPGVGTAAGIAAGTGVSTAAGLAERLFQE